jgi:hypothetical protein
MITKYGAGLLGSEPGDRPYAAMDVAQRVAAATSSSGTVDEHRGSATVLGSTVTSSPMGQEAVAVIETEAAARTIVTSSDPAVVEAFQADDHVGRSVAVDGSALRG